MRPACCPLATADSSPEAAVVLIVTVRPGQPHTLDQLRCRFRHAESFGARALMFCQ